MSPHVLSDFKELAARADKATDARIAVKADSIPLGRFLSLSHALF
jgi:hypothetical protein